MEPDDTRLVSDLSNDDGPQTPLEALRARRDEVSQKRDVLIPIVGYDEDGLKAKYRLLDRPEVDAIARRVRKQTKDRSEMTFRVLVDTIIASCEGFFLAPDGIKDDEAEALMNEAKTQPIETYAQMAQELKGEPFDNHRQAVMYVFGDNEFSVGQHGLLLMRWLGDTNLDIDNELLLEG